MGVVIVCRAFGSGETEWKKPKAPDHPLYQRPAGTGHRNDRCTGQGRKGAVSGRKGSILYIWNSRGEKKHYLSGWKDSILWL